MSSYYPIYLNLNGKRALVVGGGEIAEGKIGRLRQTGADITVVSPEATRGIVRYADCGEVCWLKREYRDGDLDGAFIVIAATNQRDVNQRIFEDADRLGILLNVVDDPPRCNFIAPSIVERGPVTLAISTGGASPALARKLRESLGESAELKWADMAGVMSAARKRLRETGVSVDPQHWQCCLGDDLLDLVQAGRETEALESLLTRLLSEHTAGPCAGASQRPSTTRRA